MKLVHVVWEDATELDDTPWTWHEDSFVYTSVLVNQVGFLLYDGPEGIVITDAYIDTQVSRRNQIPRGMIKELKFLDINNG